MRSLQSSVIILIALTLLAAPLGAQNLIQNGGFEDGDAWWYYTYAEDRDGNYLSGWWLTDEDTHTGSYAMKIYGYDTYELFQIDVNTVAGASYDLSFWFRFASDEGNNHLEVLWNDDTIATFQDVPYQDEWVQYTYRITGTGGPSTLTFRGGSGGSPSYLDDVQLSPSAVPEFPTLIPFGLFALSGIAMARRRRLSG